MPSPEHPLVTPSSLLATMLTRMAWLAFGGVLCAGIVFAASRGSTSELPKFYLIFQDALPLAIAALFCLAATRMLKASHPSASLEPILRLQGWGPIWAIAALAALVAYAGAYIVYQHFALSLDEFMADFDARIIASGRLLAPVSSEWRDYVPALQPIFRLAVPENAFWVSSYLPVNAAIRALFLLLGDPALEGAVLAAVALLALYGIARRLWPERPDAALVAVLLLACSPQFLITAMTPYAMTAHLALNLIWLWLFLRDTRTSHVLAAIVGFAACGLHQVIFHPLFVAPFLFSLLLTRRWKLSAFYAAAYAAIGLFWILYWNLLLHGTGEAAAQSADLGIAHLFRRVAEMIQPSSASIAFMGLNIFRFVAWQAFLAIPLALVGFVAHQRQNFVVRDLALGIFLTLAAMMILMPHQGHGLGYRYLHGLLGSVSLLAAQGWIYLSSRRESGRQSSLLAAALAISVLVILPWYAYQTYRFVKPYASTVAALERSDAQIVLVDPMDIGFGSDLVRNDPLLRNSPKMMALGYLDGPGLRKLCSRYDIAVFDGKDASRFGFLIEPSEIAPPELVQHYRELRQVMASLNCGRRVLDSRP